MAGPVPDVDSLERVQGPIDSYVLHKLEGEGLSMSAPASKRTLMRRAFLDLWGLPPTPEEAAAFLDDEAPGAFDRLLDRLLESPKYGQRWVASGWTQPGMSTPPGRTSGPRIQSSLPACGATATT